MPDAPSMFYTFHFYLFGLIAIVSAIVFVTRRSPVAAAMWLVVVMFSLAALYVLLDAEFIGVIQVLVYAGAIMVVFLFVVMLLNLGQPSQTADARGLWWQLTAGAVGIALVAELFTVIHGVSAAPYTLPTGSVAAQVASEGAIAPFADALFHQYLLPFELTSVVLLAAIVGAVVLGIRRTDAR